MHCLMRLPGCLVDAEGCVCCVGASFDETDPDKASSFKGGIKHAAAQGSTSQSRQTGDELGGPRLVLEKFSV